ncbi:MAG: hypothetical protein QME32_05395, partial [Endomicrobiia bacterium]|nr:hypothetical protein [Endomicrobiia bacterium]
GRFGGKAFEGHSGSAFYYLLVTLAWLFPWSAFIPESIAEAKKHRALTACLIAAAVPLAIFSVSKTKLPNYAAPMFPPLAVVLGRWLNGFVLGGDAAQEERKGLRIFSIFMAVAVGAAAGAAFLLAEKILNANATKLSHTAPYLSDGVSLGAAPYVIGGALFASSLWVLFFFRRKSARTLITGLALSSLAVCLAMPFAARNVWRAAQKPLKELTMDAAKASGGSANIIAYELAMSPSVAFYAGRKIEYLGRGELIEIIKMKKAERGGKIRGVGGAYSPVVISKKSDFTLDLGPAGFILIREAGGYALAR